MGIIPPNCVRAPVIARRRTARVVCRTHAFRVRERIVITTNAHDAARPERGKPRVWVVDDDHDDASWARIERHHRADGWGFHARAATESRARATECARASVVRDGARTCGCE